MTTDPHPDLQKLEAAIVARHERLRSQAREAERHPAKASGAGVEGLFQSLLALSFVEGLSESFHN